MLISSLVNANILRDKLSNYSIFLCSMVYLQRIVVLLSKVLCINLFNHIV